MPSDIEIYDSKHLDDMERVAALTLQGNNPTEIARATGIKRKDVLSIITEWKQTTMIDEASRDIARDALNSMVQHYDRLIKQSYDLLDKLNTERFSHQVAGQINSTLKNISEYEAKRVDALQKAGILDANDMGDELAEMEEKQAILIDILRNDLCSNCRRVVGGKLSSVTNHAEVVVKYE